MSQPLLIAEEIGTVFDAPDRRVAVYSEYFELYPGDTVILQAPSGAGKSSLLALLGCALRPVHAKRFEVVTRKGDVINVALAWRENDEAALIAARRECFGFVLQTGALAPFLSVSQNITAARLFTPDAPPVDVSALAASLNIADLLNLRPPQLSVGQRQRVAVARALAGGPSVILADEPTASLDLDLADEVDGVLADAVRSSNACMIIASHRPDARVWRDVPRAETRTDRGHQMLATVFNHRNPKRRKAA